MPWGYVAGAVAGAVANNALSSSSGGGGGGSSNAYIPNNQPGMDTNFQNLFTNYQNTLGNFNNTVSPLNSNLLQSQFNSPLADNVMRGSVPAALQYGSTAQNAAQGSSNMFDAANSNANWQHLVQNGMIVDAPQIQNAYEGMMSAANQSNQLFGGLIGYQQGQQGNVQGAANNLYGAANAIQNTAFDPQNALYDRTRQQITDQTRAAEYARGIQSSPYGAAVESNALNNFNIDWQNQQLARQSQGVAAMEGANQSAQAMNNSYTNNLAGLQQGMNSNYSGLTTNAANLLENWSQSQANVASQFGNALGSQYQTAAGLGNTAGQAYMAMGSTPYLANQMIYGNQNQALQNYGNNMQQYLSGTGNLMGQATQYMGLGSAAQQAAFNQSNTLGQQFGALSGQIANGVRGIFNGSTPNYSGTQVETYGPMGSYADNPFQAVDFLG